MAMSKAAAKRRALRNAARRELRRKDRELGNLPAEAVLPLPTAVTAPSDQAAPAPPAYREYSGEVLDVLRKAWLTRADGELSTLPKLMRDLAEFRDHDYNTAAYAVGIFAYAAFRVMSRALGITGFQASAAAWEFIEAAGLWGPGPKRVVSYEEMLYPQFARKFRKEITAETAAWLQERAREKLEQDGEPHPAVAAHWRKLAAGWIPFGYEVEEDPEVLAESTTGGRG